MDDKRTIRTMGVMTFGITGASEAGDHEFYSSLSLEGEKSGIRVILFAPPDIDIAAKSVTGYRLHSETRRWLRTKSALPGVIYDRTFMQNPVSNGQREAIRQISGQLKLRMLGRELPGKWNVYRSLYRHNDLRPYLPETERFQGFRQLMHWLRKGDGVFLKPALGSQGRATLRIALDSDTGFRVSGRDRGNRMFERSFDRSDALCRWVEACCGPKGLIGSSIFLIQPALRLHAQSGRVFDIRSLVQKNGFGRWELTGMAARCGVPGSITANLHGGGTAEAAEPFLEREFGKEKAAQLLAELAALSIRLAGTLEESYGRLAELGIDFGIDSSGDVWFLEANSKPGRSVFRRIRNEDAAGKAVANPVAYARYLLGGSHT